MKETGLMFKAPLVRAILSGQKTQTRRVVKPAPAADQELTTIVPPSGKPYAFSHERIDSQNLRRIRWESPVGQPGDRIYVRETFVQGYEEDPLTGRLKQWDEQGNDIPMTAWYRATDGGITWSDDGESETNVPWKPSIHMPKELARIWLEITGVRVEHLQGISDADLAREGIQEYIDKGDDHDGTPRDTFRKLWETTGGDWAANPWVWVIDFKRIEKPR